MMMSLASLFDDYPVLQFDDGLPRRRTSAGDHLLCSVLNGLQDQMDQKVGQVFRRLPAIVLDLEDNFDNNGPRKKRKLRSGVTSEYEPKSKAVVTNKDNKFKISLDTSNYQPEEITVKVVNNKLAISAKHESRGTDVYEFYEMYRSFDLPENVDPTTVTSRLGANGELSVEAPLKAPPETKTINISVAIESKEQQASVESTVSPN